MPWWTVIYIYIFSVTSFEEVAVCFINLFILFSFLFYLFVLLLLSWTHGLRACYWMNEWTNVVLTVRRQASEEGAVFRASGQPLRHGAHRMQLGTDRWLLREKWPLSRYPPSSRKRVLFFLVITDSQTNTYIHGQCSYDQVHCFGLSWDLQ